MKARTGMTGTDEEIVAWYRANEGKLVFDQETQMYRVAEQP